MEDDKRGLRITELCLLYWGMGKLILPHSNVANSYKLCTQPLDGILKQLNQILLERTFVHIWRIEYFSFCEPF